MYPVELDWRFDASSVGQNAVAKRKTSSPYRHRTWAASVIFKFRKYYIVKTLVTESRPGRHGYQWRQIRDSMLRHRFWLAFSVIYALRPKKNNCYDLNSVFFVRYELRLKKGVRIEQTIPHGINTWQHLVEETNPWFSLRIRKRHMKEPEK